ncbi:DUF2254 domain-containing protein [Rhodococcus opacus]|uniref:DUF2254 domain-containing protein n=1 Tax=Rhodococcus opacus TaxID=37919 RepID=A0AAX3Y8Z0_RHOOP|nr:DUF2254 family protein [Rhodococcus opacus]MCZ4586207.1 DUF2254 domain-containing protein [Rhodococcus opacus]WLF44670.1 DUF2254 family protein [Rhodococcus opacus]
MSKAATAGAYRHRRILNAELAVLYILAGLGLGLTVPRIRRGPDLPAQQVIGVLTTIGLGVLGLVAVILSLGILVGRWAASNYSPRLTQFRDTPILRQTFAFALGVTVFCISAAFTIGPRARVSMAVLITAIVLLVLMAGLLRTLQVTVATSIQLSPVLSSIAARGRNLLDAAYPDDAGTTASPAAPLPAPCTTVTWPNPTTVLQRIQVDRLVCAAQAANAVIVLRAAPGITLQCGVPVADIHGQLPASVVLGGLVVGSERTFEQDPLFAFRLLTDIALRALRPNDPATTVQALDYIEDLLGRAAAAPTEPRRVTDQHQVLRLVIARPSWEEFVRTSLDDLIPAAATTPSVLIRLQLLLERVQHRAHPDHHEVLTARLTRVNDHLTKLLPPLA